MVALAAANLLLAVLIVVVYANAFEPRDNVRMSQALAVVLTTSILVGWTLWIPLSASAVLRSRGAGWLVIGFYSVLVLVPTLPALTLALSFSNECNSAGGFPFDSSC